MTSSDAALPDWYTAGAQHLWLPYAQMKTTTPPLPVSHTQGCSIHLTDGRVLLDGMASWWSACHGYNHPHIVEAIRQQAATMPHIMSGGLYHEPATTLATRLARMTPGALNHVFFADSGSIAVEIALKMALQYWRNQGNRHKGKFLCFRHGYHGDTLGAMSVSDPESSLHRAYQGVTHMQYVVDIPSDEYGFADFEALLRDIHHGLAAVIIEPLVQGAGGMKFHSPDVLAEIRRLCAAHAVLFIADEIMTGFGRTGTMFACEEADIVPDILCLGKALTGGALSLAATIATDHVYDAFYGDELLNGLMHGPTFMGNALACAAANASLDLFEQEPRLQQITAIEQQLYEELAPCASLPGVCDVRVKGAIGVVQLQNPDFADITALRTRFVQQDVWLRPIEDIVYIMPSFTISEQELARLTDAVYTTIKSAQGNA